MSESAIFNVFSADIKVEIMQNNDNKGSRYYFIRSVANRIEKISLLFREEMEWNSFTAVLNTVVYKEIKL